MIEQMPARKSILNILLGAPLPAGDKRERVGRAAGISIFGLDALSSAAYQPVVQLYFLSTTETRHKTDLRNRPTTHSR
jgi:hypothetical protein